MFQIVIVLFKGGTRVIRRVDINALDLSGELLFQRFQRKKVVAVNQHIDGVRVAVILRGGEIVDAGVQIDDGVRAESGQKIVDVVNGVFLRLTAVGEGFFGFACHRGGGKMRVWLNE